MAIKHHQALDTTEYEIFRTDQKFHANVKVYDTNYTYPTNGINVEYYSISDVTSPEMIPEYLTETIASDWHHNFVYDSNDITTGDYWIIGCANSGWTEVSSEIAPDGTSLAFWCGGKSGDSNHACIISKGYPTNPDVLRFNSLDDKICLSAYVKNDSANAMGINVYNQDDAISHTLYFNWVGGVPVFYSSGNSQDYGIESVGDGWYRVWVLAEVQPSDIGGQAQVYLYPNYNQVNTNGSYVWGVQLERVQNGRPSQLIKTAQYLAYAPFTRQHLTGTIPNLICDWEGGGPSGITSQLWTAKFSGNLWGLSTSDVGSEVIFRLSYSGNVKLFYGNNDFVANPYLWYDDWDYKADGDTVTTVDVTAYIVNDGITFTTRGANYFQIDYWNGSKKPHLVAKVKRVGIDDDFVLLGCSTVEADSTTLTYGQSYTATATAISSVTSFEIKRDHEKITACSFEMIVPNREDTFAYDPDTDSFGPVGKGKYVEVYAGYNNLDAQKRFVGNITKAIEATRTKEYTTISVSCEGILAAALDEKNYTFPNNASYSCAGFFDNEDKYTNPDGVVRPRAFDQWPVKAAVEVLALQSGIDPSYLIGKRSYYTNTGSVVDSTHALLRDLDLNLSRQAYYGAYQVNPNAEKPDYIWEYDFGQDSAYDIIKDMLNKYGFYIKELEAGDLCGSLELVEIKSPFEIKDTLYSSSNVDTNIIRKTAEGFKGHMGDSGTSSTLSIDFTGNSVDLVMGIGPVYGRIKVEYAETIGGSFYEINGYYNDGTYFNTNIIDTNAMDERYYYDGINITTGKNPTIYNLVLRDPNNTAVPLDYGAHRLRVTGQDADTTFFFDSIRMYDYQEDTVYKEYSTQTNILELTPRHNIEDIRNDIVVLGASTAGFAFTADEDSLEEVQTKYITSRIIDTQSIYNKDYKYYVGRNKKFIIEDPTIVTQERADWLALYALETYRKTGMDVVFKIPADLGLQLYDTVRTIDYKTGSLDETRSMYVDSVVEKFTTKEYLMNIKGKSVFLPQSFQKKEVVTPELLSTLFDNCPICFEKLNVPLLDGSTGYDPMTSEDGMFIELEWTQLIPGVCSIEVFDSLAARIDGTTRSPQYGGSGLNDDLVAVPYLSTTDSRPGVYRALWDGVHENYEANGKYNDTHYSLNFNVPNGTGFFARGQYTPEVDKVRPTEIDDSYTADLYSVHFPLYVVAKFQPTVSGYQDVTTEYIFGSHNGQSYFNGVLNTANNDLTMDHFQLEERLPLVWQWDEDNINYPTDATRFVIHYNDPYDSAVDLYTDSSTYDWQYYSDLPQYDDLEIDATIMNFDSHPPYGYQGAAGPGDYKKLMSLPVVDQTANIRVFVDKDVGDKNRRFYAKKLDIVYSVVTVITDYRHSLYPTREYRDFLGHIYNYPMDCRFCFNYTFSAVTDGQPVSDFVTASQKLTIGDWNYVAKYADKDTKEAVVFSADLNNMSTSLNVFDPQMLVPSRTSVGLGVGNVLAIPHDKIGTFTMEDEDAIRYLVNTPTRVTVLGNNDNRYHLPNSTIYVDGEYNPHPSNQSQHSIHGSTTDTRKIYNTVLISIEAQFIDRAGRVYFSAAAPSGDQGNFLVGRHNDMQIHGEFSRQLMKYVNRYNPYLPTACYMEKSPGSLSLENFKQYSAYSWSTEEDLSQDYDGENLSLKVVNTNAGLQQTTLDPFLCIRAPVSPETFGEYFLPLMARAHEDLMGLGPNYFGRGQANNNLIYRTSDLGSGDGNTVTEDQMMPYNLKTYIIGGATARYATLENQVTDIGDVSTEDHYPSPSQWYYDRRYQWDRPLLGYNVLTDTYDPQAFGYTTYTPINQRGGLFSYFHNMPVFTLVSGITKQVDVNYDA